MKRFETVLGERFFALFPDSDITPILSTLAETYRLLGASKEARMLEAEELWLR